MITLDMPIAEAVRRVMRGHYERITPAEWAASDVHGWSSHPYKELRVAVRCLRDDLREFGFQFRQRPVRELRMGARAFAHVLRAPREFDMLLTRAERFASPGDGAADANEAPRRLAPLLDALKSLRHAARAQLVDYLNTAEHRRWHEHLLAFIDDDGARFERARRIGKPTLVRHVLMVRLWDHVAAVRAFDVLPDLPSPEHLHDLRIAVKRLRYFVDAWQKGIHSTPSQPILEACIALQHHLGEINDAHNAVVCALDFVARNRKLHRSELNEILQFAEQQQRIVEQRTSAWRALLAPLSAF